MSDEETYRELFVAESRENHEMIVNSLIVLEKGSDDTAIAEIFRAAHTLKGMSASMGYTAMEQLCHAMEDVFHLIRSGNMEVTNDLVSILLNCTDLIESMIDDIEEGVDVPIELVSGTVGELHAIAGAGEEPHPESSETAMDFPDLQASTMSETEGTTDSAPEYLIRVNIDSGCQMKDIRAMIILGNLDDLGRIISVVPPREEVEDGKFDESFDIRLLSDSGEKALEAAISGPDISSLQITICEPDSMACEPEFAGREPDTDTADDQAPAPTKKQEKNREIKNIRVDIDRLDHMMNLVEDLVINRGRLVQIAEKFAIKEFDEALNMVGRSVSDLQNLMMNIRMIPLNHIFNRLPRVVRDVATHDGKEVEFVIEGGETELDRSVMDGLNDPLLHIIRNAVNHGIETPEERERAGKPRKGILKLTARRDKDNVIIEIEDDGKGIDPEKLRKKAVEKGMMAAEDAENATKDELIGLLFQPGFSTAEQITDISGRGVGLDVVRSVIESLKGSIKVESEMGEGSRWELVLPPTMAIVDVMMVRINDLRCAIPINNVEEVASIKAHTIHRIGKSETILLRNEVLSLHRLEDMFGKSEVCDTVVVVQSYGKKSCILVDLVEGKQEVVVKPLSPLVGNCRGVNGVTIPGDGDVVPVLDVNTMI